MIGTLTPTLSNEIREIGFAFNRLRKHWATPVQDRKNDVAVAFLLVEGCSPVDIFCELYEYSKIGKEMEIYLKDGHSVRKLAQLSPTLTFP